MRMFVGGNESKWKHGQSRKQLQSLVVIPNYCVRVMMHCIRLSQRYPGSIAVSTDGAHTATFRICLAW
jgi:hypothetical protein